MKVTLLLTVIVSLATIVHGKNPKNTYSVSELEAVQAEALEKEKPIVYILSNSKTN